MRFIGILLIVPALFFPILAVNPVGAAPSYLSVNSNWLQTVHSGCDPYYNPGCGYFYGSVSAYKSDANATLVVTVSNPSPGNSSSVWFISAVKVWMDWGTNYTSNQASRAYPVMLTQNSAKTFTVSFLTPGPSVVSSLLAHNYQVIIEFISGPDGTSQGAYTQSGTGFAIYSQDQVDVWTLMGQLGLNSGSGASSVLCGLNTGPYGAGSQRTFTTPQANSLCLQAAREVNVGMTSYQLGNFIDAKTHLQNAVSYWNQAIALDSSSGSFTNAGSVVMNLLVGIGVVLGGVGAAIYSIKKSMAPASTRKVES